MSFILHIPLQIPKTQILLQVRLDFFAMNFPYNFFLTTFLHSSLKDMNTEKNQPSLVKELETALILRELSQRRTPSPVPEPCQNQENRGIFLPHRQKFVPSTPSCDNVNIQSRKRLRTPKTHVSANVPVANPARIHSQVHARGSLFQPDKRLKAGNGGKNAVSNMPSVNPLPPPPSIHAFNNFHRPERQAKNTLNSNMHKLPIQLQRQQLLSNSTAYNTQLNIALLAKSIIQRANNYPMCYPINTLVPTQVQSHVPLQKLLSTPEDAILLASRTSNKLKNPLPVKEDVGIKVKICRMEGCNDPAAKRTPYCSKHSGPRKCEFQGCKKCAQGRTRFCISHGGGRRCMHPDCNKGARDKKFCASHGGGRRCNIESCNKLAVGGGHKCTAHGGGRRCQSSGCNKSAQSSSSFCVRHGGGRKCKVENCRKVARGKSGLCMSHATQLQDDTNEDQQLN